MKSTSPQALHENYIKRTEQTPIKRFRYKDYEVYISEGGPYYVNNYPNPEEVKKTNNLESEFWYEATYAIGRDDKIVFWMPIVFDGMHDIHSLTLEGRLQARINAAVVTAKEVIDGEAMFLKNYQIDSRETRAILEHAET